VRLTWFRERKEGSRVCLDIRTLTFEPLPSRNSLHARRTSQTIIKMTIIVPTTPIPSIVPPYPTRKASRLPMHSL
jgi:hypothetical protein